MLQLRGHADILPQILVYPYMYMYSVVLVLNTFVFQFFSINVLRAGIFKKSMGARHRGGIGFSYRPARLHRLAEFIPWNQFRGPINLKVRALCV
jgi:hypothetical protein